MISLCHADRNPIISIKPPFLWWFCSLFSSGGGVPSTFLSFRLFLVTAEHITMSIQLLLPLYSGFHALLRGVVLLSFLKQYTSKQFLVSLGDGVPSLHCVVVFSLLLLLSLIFKQETCRILNVKFLRSELNELVENLTCLDALEGKIWKINQKVVTDEKSWKTWKSNQKICDE